MVERPRDTASAPSNVGKQQMTVDVRRNLCANFPDREVGGKHDQKRSAGSEGGRAKLPLRCETPAVGASVQGGAGCSSFGQGTPAAAVSGLRGLLVEAAVDHHASPITNLAAGILVTSESLRAVSGGAALFPRRMREICERETMGYSAANCASLRPRFFIHSVSVIRAIVHAVRISRKPICAFCIVDVGKGLAHTMHMAKSPHFLRAWRKHRSYTLQQAGERIGMTHQNLGKIERGEVPYNEHLLERLAQEYRCEPVDLLIRDPLDPEGMWSIYDQLKPVEKRQLVEMAKVIKRTGTNT